MVKPIGINPQKPAHAVHKVVPDNEYFVLDPAFTDSGNYNSIRLKETRSVRIRTEHEITLADLKPKGLARYKDLIPQANDLNKVTQLVFKVHEGIDDYRRIAEHFGFGERRGSYYREAAEALGLVVSEKRRYALTEVGKMLVKLPAEKRNVFMAELVSDFVLLPNCLDILEAQGRLGRSELEKLIGVNSKLTGSTTPRGAGSLVAWFKWIAEVTGGFALENGAFRTKA